MKVAMWLIIVSIITFLLLMLFLYIQLHTEYREKNWNIPYKRWIPTRWKLIVIILKSLIPLVNIIFLIAIIHNACTDEYEVRFVRLNLITKIVKWLKTEVKIKD